MLYFIRLSRLEKIFERNRNVARRRVNRESPFERSNYDVLFQDLARGFLSTTRNMTKNLMRKAMENGDHRGAHGHAYKDKSKPTDIRSSNINAAKGKSDHRDMSFSLRRVKENITLYSNVPRLSSSRAHRYI